MAFTDHRDDASGSTKGDVVTSDTRGRLIAEALRLYVGAGNRVEDEPKAEAAARNAEGDLENKIIVYALNSGTGAKLESALRQLTMATRIVTIVGLAMAVLAGAATAYTALDAPAGTSVNFHWVLLSLIGVETIALFIWILFALAAPGKPRSASLGALASGIGRWLASVMNRGVIKAALARSMATVYGQGAVARWSFGAMTHGLWLAFLVGAFAMSLLSLSVKQLHFVWQTTILSQETYLPATEVLAALPRMVGVPTPTADEIRTSRWTGKVAQSPQVSRKWAALLLASLVLYAILPRACLLVFCWFRRSSVLRRWRLNLDHPEYQRLRDRLVAPNRETRIIDDTDVCVRSPPAEIEAEPSIAFDGAVALIGLETELPATGWPPTLRGIDWTDLGSIDDRDDLEHVLTAIRTLDPGLVLLVVSLLTTPDRGIEGFVKRVREATPAPMAMLLTDITHIGQRLRDSDVAQRKADWRNLCAGAGIPSNWTIEYEISSPGPRDRARLSRLLGIDEQ